MAYLKTTGLYTIVEDYFRLFPEYPWDYNKDGKRPYYYALSDNHGFMWMIPITTKVVQVKAKIAKEEAKRGVGNCMFYHIGKIAGEERGFKIGDMFPITPKYILHNYAIDKKPYFVEDKGLNKALISKARKYVNLLERGSLHSTVDILEVRKRLTEESEQSSV